MALGCLRGKERALTVPPRRASGRCGLLDTCRNRADNTLMRGKSRREQIASMLKAKRLELLPLARKVRADAIAW